MICGLFVLSISVFAQHNYCDPKPVISLEGEQKLYWQCDCKRARRSIRFVIQEEIDKAILMAAKRGE